MANKTTSAPVEPMTSSNGLAIASLVLGILSLTGFLFLAGVPAIITGIMSLRKGQTERGMSIAGIIMGSIGVLLSLLALMFIIFIIVLGVMSDPSNPSGMPSVPSTDTQMYMPIESSRT
jgi:hypothetical protein